MHFYELRHWCLRVNAISISSLSSSPRFNDWSHKILFMDLKRIKKSPALPKACVSFKERLVVNFAYLSNACITKKGEKSDIKSVVKEFNSIIVMWCCSSIKIGRWSNSINRGVGTAFEGKLKSSKAFSENSLKQLKLKKQKNFSISLKFQWKMLSRPPHSLKRLFLDCRSTILSPQFESEGKTFSST